MRKPTELSLAFSSMRLEAKVKSKLRRRLLAFAAAVGRVRFGWSVLGGGALGALIGGVVGAAMYKPDLNSIDFGRGFDVIVGAIVGVPIGLAAGLTVWLLSRLARVNWKWAVVLGVALIAAGGAFVVNVISSGGNSVGDLKWQDENPAWSPTGRQIVFDTNRTDPRGHLHAIYVMRSDGTNVRRLTATTIDGEYPSFSPNGSDIVYVADLVNAAGDYTGHGVLRLVRADGSGDTSLAIVGNVSIPPAWSPHGRLIAYLDSGGGIYVTAPAGTTALPRYARSSWPIATGQRFAWAPNGESIAFEGADEQIHTVQLASGKQIQVSHNDEKLSGDSDGFEILSIAWSPDGRQVAYVHGQVFVNTCFFGCPDTSLGDAHAFVVDASGRNQHRVASPKGRGDDWGVAWLPGGPDTLLLESGEGINVVTADGGYKRLATDGCCATPSPDGKEVALVRDGRSLNDSNAPQPSAIFLASIDGHSLTRLTQTSQ
jgi:Tol biopolymer transport system component